MHHYTLDKNKKRIKVRQENRRAERVLNESIDEMKPPKDVKETIVSSQQGVTGRVKNVGKLVKDTMGIRHDHYDLVIESLAGPNSIMDYVFYKDIKDGINIESATKQQSYKIFEDTLNFEEFQARYDISNMDKWINERIKTGKWNLTRGERMSLYKHSLNEDNRRSITEAGIGFKSSDNPDKVYKMTEEELSNIVESLSPAELEYAGKPTNSVVEYLQDGLSQVFYDVNGYPMPLENNYWPKDVMSVGVSRQTQEEMQIEEMRRASQLKVGTSKGFLQRRQRVAVPLYLNDISYDLNNLINRNSAYIGLEKPMRNASKLLYNKTFRGEMSRRYGRQTWKEIEKGMKDIVNDWTSYSTTEQILLKFKNKMSTAILGLNPFVMAKQILSYPLYNIYVDFKYLMRGFSDYILSSKDVKSRHEQYSPEYMERISSGYSRDVADVFKTNATDKFTRARKSIPEKLMTGIKLFDEAAVTPGMQGAVLQVLDEFDRGELSGYVKQALDITEDSIPETAEEKMKFAYKYADWVTERTQPMFRPEHRSSLSRGTPTEQLLTQFSAFTNQSLNIARRLYRDSKRDKDTKSYGKMIHFAMLMLLNATGVGLLNFARDRFLKGQEDAAAGKEVGEAILDTPFSMFYFVRDMEYSVKNKIERGTFLGADVNIPVMRIPNLLSETISNGFIALDPNNKKGKKKKAADDFIDNFMELSLILNGIPYHTPRQLLGTFTEKKGKKTSSTRRGRRTR